MAVDIENIATLKKISTQNDFEELYREHFDRKEISFLHEDLDVDFSERMWQKTNNLERSVKGLYEALTEDIRLKVREMLVNGKSHINSDKIEETVTTYLIMNMARLSDRLITAEATHHDMNENEFVGYISDNREAFLELFSKYPYWGTLVKRFLKDSHIFFGEIITRLTKDIEAIGTQFWGKEIFADDIVLNLGDRHRGRFVVEVKTSAGDFFYKPRSIATDKMFQDFCDRLAASEWL